MKIKILHLFPDLLNLYGDSGNIESLRKRLAWRGIDAEVREYKADNTDFDLSDVDILFLGGGTEREERIAVSKLMAEKEKILDYVNSGKSLFAVCGGFRMLGKYSETDENKQEELGILDFYTKIAENGFIGDVVMESSVIGCKIVGFENHRERYFIEKYKPLGEIVRGNGNNGTDGNEGLVYKGVVATNLHGPLLPKNPKLCDYILENALKIKYSEFEGLSPLSDDLENKANNLIVERYKN